MIDRITGRLLCLLAACASAPLAAQAVPQQAHRAAAPRTPHPADEAINAVYGELVRARAAGDVAGMVAAFPADAILIDSRPNAAMGGGPELDSQLRPFATKLSADGVKVATEYRIERRSVRGNIAVDAGYMRMQMTRPDGKSGTRYARFLVTLVRDEANRWRIIGDASLPSDEGAWQAVPRLAGLRHDG